MFKRLNNKGSLLVNSLLAISLSSIILLNISSSTVRTAKLQNTIFERDLLVSYMEAVSVDIIPLVYFDFFIEFVETTESFTSSTSQFLGVIEDHMNSLDPNNVLLCEPAYYESGGLKIYDFYLVCTPPPGDTLYTISFTVTQIKSGNPKIHEITHILLETEPIA